MIVKLGCELCDYTKEINIYKAFKNEIKGFTELNLLSLEKLMNAHGFIEYTYLGQVYVVCDKCFDEFERAKKKAENQVKTFVNKRKASKKK